MNLKMKNVDEKKTCTDKNSILALFIQKNA